MTFVRLWIRIRNKKNFIFILISTGTGKIFFLSLTFYSEFVLLKFRLFCFYSQFFVSYSEFVGYILKNVKFSKNIYLTY